MINLQCINLSAAGGSGSGGGGQVATPNATIFGAPVINGSQVSGFTANDYLQMPRVIDFAGKQWQLDFQFTTGEDVTTQQNIVDSGFGLAIAVSQGKMLVALSSNGTSWDLGAHAGTHAVAANTGYFVRMTFDDSKYVVAIGTDGKTYETDITVTATASLFPRVILIGKSTDSRYIFGGIINLAEATLYIDGKEEWTGMTGGNYATKTEVKQLASEVTELDQKVGDLSRLETTAKDNLVDAINEAAQGGGGSLDLCSFTKVAFHDAYLTKTCYDKSTHTFYMFNKDTTKLISFNEDTFERKEYVVPPHAIHGGGLGFNKIVVQGTRVYSHIGNSLSCYDISTSSYVWRNTSVSYYGGCIALFGDELFCITSEGLNRVTSEGLLELIPGITVNGGYDTVVAFDNEVYFPNGNNTKFNKYNTETREFETTDINVQPYVLNPINNLLYAVNGQNVNRKNKDQFRSNQAGFNYSTLLAADTAISGKIIIGTSKRTVIGCDSCKVVVTRDGYERGNVYLSDGEYLYISNGIKGFVYTTSYGVFYEKY